MAFCSLSALGSNLARHHISARTCERTREDVDARGAGGRLLPDLHPVDAAALADGRSDGAELEDGIVQVDDKRLT